MSGGEGSFGDGAPETAGRAGDEEDVRHDSDLSCDRVDSVEVADGAAVDAEIGTADVCGMGTG